MSDELNLTGLLDTLEAETAGPKITFEDILSVLESRGFGPLLLFPSLLLILPTGAIPGMPMICGFFIALISVQLAMGFKGVRLPKSLLKMSLNRQKFIDASQKIKPATKKIDKYIHPRFLFLSSPPMERIIAVICIFLAIAVMIMGWVPFAVMIPASSIVFFALGLTSKDGILLAIGLGGVLFAALTMMHIL